MKCKNCGGELHFENGVAKCDSCGNQYKIDHFYEDLDVYICYIECDAAGRRTRDSMIAQEIYQKLESKKIKTFYERISAAEALGDDLEQLRYSSLCDAKVVLVVGTGVDRFRTISEKYGKYFTGKTIVPVFSDVNPSDIPAELGRYQALNYASIGWEKDLERGLLRILGRESELESEKTQNKGKGILLGMIAAAVLLAVGLVIFLNRPQEAPKTPAGEPVTQETTAPPKTNQQIYDDAKALAESGSYMEAIECYQSIPAYKDSQNQIISLYNRFDGYYQDEQQMYSIYLNIVNGKFAEIIFKKTEDRKILKIEETVAMENNQIKGTYVDSFENEGEISVALQNNQITVTVSTTVESGKMSAGNVTVSFLTANKADRPPIKEVTREDLLYWVSNPTSPDDIKAAGFELEYIDTQYEYSELFGTQYKITNSDITIITTNINFEKYRYEYGEDIPVLDNYVVVGIIAPVTLVCPEKIGHNSCAFSESGIVFVPNGNYCSRDDDSVFKFSEDEMSSGYGYVLKTMDIKDNSFVGFASENLVGKRYCDLIMKNHQEQFCKSWVHQHYLANNSVSNNHYVFSMVLEEKHNTFLICVHDRLTYNGLDYGNSGTFNYYEYDLNAGKSRFLAQYNQVSYINRFGSREYSYDIWKKYPEIFGKFLEDTAQDKSYLIEIKTEDYNIFSQPSYESNIVQVMPTGVYTIVEEQTDSEGNLWGRLKSGLGWICITDIQT